MALLLALLVAHKLVILSGASPTVLLHDASGARLERSESSATVVTPERPGVATGRVATGRVATGTLCAASGLVPPYAIDQSTAAEVAALVQPQKGLGRAPQAVVLLHLAGISAGEVLVV